MKSDCDVLIVGLGPVGATLAALLVREGVRVIAVERDAAVYPLPRAAHFDHEIMRLFQHLGIADEVLRHARTAPSYEFRNAKGDALLKFDLDRQGHGGWPQSFMFNQPGVETALRALLTASPLADVRLDTQFAGFSSSGEGIAARLTHANGEDTVTARFLVGCDGARSAVREAAGFGLFDYAFDEPWLVIDAIPDADAPVPRENLQICDPKRPTTCVLMGPGRHRWEFMLKPDETAEQVLDDGFIHALLEPWGCAGKITIDRKAVYRFHGLVATEWRAGPVLIAGDAAHQMPPFAGQGMCAGLRDAANLAWKLAAVLRGAPDPILDTYQVEREPHVRQTIDLAMGMGRVVCTTDPEAAAARDAQMLSQKGAPPAPAPASVLSDGLLLRESKAAGAYFPQAVASSGNDPLRLDDVLGSGPWLISRKPSGVKSDGIRAAATGDTDLTPFANKLNAWLDTQGCDAVLVRPDRFVFATGTPRELLDAWRAAT